MILDEHHGYISDHVRVSLFRQAITQIISSSGNAAPVDTVADVGCGFGILGLLCLRAGAAHCWGIDKTDAIEIARETMAKAGLGDRYTCIREETFRARLPEQVDLIICDHVGYFGIDYGILDMIGDARRRFLKPGGQIMPSRIKLFLAAVSSRTCRAKAEAWSDEAVPAEFQWLREYGVNTKQAHRFKPKEVLTDPAELITIDLNASVAEHFAFQTSLRVIRDGQLDGLVGWFACELANDVWMTNSPLDKGAIDRDQAFLPFDHPVTVKAGDIIETSVTIRHDTGMIAWSIHVLATGERLRQSNWNSLVLNKAMAGPASDQVARLNAAGAARKSLYASADGHRTIAEIAQAVQHDHPHLFPSPEEITRFVKHELARSTG